MSPNLDAVRLQMERWQIAFWVSEFLKDGDAIRAMKENRAIDLRIQALAEKAFLDGVERCRDWGYLLYLHDGSTLKKGT